MKNTNGNGAVTRKRRPVTQQMTTRQLAAGAKIVQKAELQPTTANIVLYLGAVTLRIEMTTR